MLVLTRKEGEDIVMSGRILIRVLWIGDGRVKLGIEAPQSVIIHRRELVEPEDKELGGES